MIEFDYKAVSVGKGVTSGRIAADSVSAAVAQLETEGLLVTSIQQVVLPAEAAQPTVSQPLASEVLLGSDGQALQERIAKVLERRDFLVPALTAFAEELPVGRTRRELSELTKQLQRGATTQELCDFSRPATAWLLLLGRKADSERLLTDLFDEATRENESHRQWNRAMIYPLLVFLGTLGVFVFFCVTLVPAFESIYDDFEMDLPTMTSWLLAISSLLQGTPVLLTLGVLAALAGVYLLLRLIRIWGLPGQLGNLLTTGSSLQVTTMARFTRRLAEALEVGLELPTALRIAGHVQQRGATRRLALQLADEAQQPNFDLSQSPAARRLPATVAHALQAGLDNQPNAALLGQLAELYTTRVRNRHNWSTGFMAQFAILGMGLTVGFVVIALFIPLVELINGLTG